MWRYLVFFSCFWVSANSWATTKAEQELDSLLAAIWDYELSISPLMASQHGKRDSDHLLPDLSKQTLNTQHQQFLTFQAELALIDDTQLSTQGRINKIMQRYRLANTVDEYRFNAHYIPITSEYGFYSAMASLPYVADFRSVKGVQNYIQRLASIPEYFQQNIKWMQRGIEAGMTLPQVIMKDYDTSVRAFITAPEKSNFYTPLTQLPDTIPIKQQAQLQQQALEVVTTKVLPAYTALVDFLVTEYTPNATQRLGAKHWPNGKHYYQNRVQYYTTTEMSVEAIHKLGLTEVKRIRREMLEVIKQVNFTGSFSEFIHFLRTDPQFYASTPEALLKQASYIAKQMDAKLPAFFEHLPRTPYGVAPVPDAIAPTYTSGRYVPPRNDRAPGYYWVNTYNLDKRPLYALPALTLHEAVPGHHLQIMLANENTSLPPVRSTYISAFGEGWALYAEHLGVEAGIYKTPYEQFGRLSYEMWRACRLVVDTGIHFYDWDRQKAINYMLNNTALSEHNVYTEVDRYISWPAQALSYKIGEILIRKLRKEAEVTLKEQFDIRKFHTAVLMNGAVPLFVLEEVVPTYLETQTQ